MRVALAAARRGPRTAVPGVTGGCLRRSRRDLNAVRRDQAGRSHASSIARRGSPLSGSERWSGRVSMRRPPSPPLTSRREAAADTPRIVPSPGIDVETRHDARRQVDGLELVGPEREPLAAERRGDRERRDALGADRGSPVRSVLPIGRRQSSMRSARMRRRSRSDSQRAERREHARVVAQDRRRAGPTDEVGHRERHREGRQPVHEAPASTTTSDGSSSARPSGSRPRAP